MWSDMLGELDGGQSFIVECVAEVYVDQALCRGALPKIVCVTYTTPPHLQGLLHDTDPTNDYFCWPAPQLDCETGSARVPLGPVC